MFKVSHEVPIGLLAASLKFNDYDYALVHLFEKYPDYYNFYRESVISGRRVILDNSAYELGEPYNLDRYRQYVLQLKPTEYILPDYKDNSSKNLQAIRDWDLKCSSVKIGVVHGESYEDYCQNYKDISRYVDKIAFSVESFFFRDEDGKKVSNPEMARVIIINRMFLDGVINFSKPHHILGALSPTEYHNFTRYSWIETVDTSNPVLHGLLLLKYNSLRGLESKSEVKMESLIDIVVTPEMREIVEYNVDWFKTRLSSSIRTKVNDEPTNTTVESYDEVKADHYRQFPIETIELFRRIWREENTALFCEMTALKYRMRLGHKPTATIEKDLQKEKWYLDKAKELRK